VPALSPLVPDPLAIFVAFCAVMGFELQVRFIEEPHLLGVHESAYSDDAQAVVRFLPGLGL
jgi:hypothetical protein